MKSQTVRIVDVFILGPLMARAGWMLRDKPIGSALLFVGVLTSLYNARNFLEARNRNG